MSKRKMFYIHNDSLQKNRWFTSESKRDKFLSENSGWELGKRNYGSTLEKISQKSKSKPKHKGKKYLVYESGTHRMKFFKSEEERSEFLKNNKNWISGNPKVIYIHNSEGVNKRFRDINKLEDFLKNNEGWSLGQYISQSKIEKLKADKVRSRKISESRKGISNPNKGKKLGKQFWVSRDENNNIKLNSEVERIEFLKLNPEWKSGKTLKKSSLKKRSKTRKSREIAVYEGKKYYANNGKLNKWFKSENELDVFLASNKNWIKGQLHSEETRKKISENSVHTDSDEIRRKRFESIIKSFESSGKRGILGSKGEKCIFNYLNSYFIAKRNYLIPNSNYSHPYDIYVYLPNKLELLIEFDGKYWHSNKNPNWSHSKDLKRELIARNHGFKFIIITEDEFNNKGLKLVKERISEHYPEIKNFSLSNANEIKSKIYG